MRQRILLLLAVLAAAPACSRPAAIFSEQNAQAHVQMLAGTIGSRPTGTAANARARAYVVDQLRLFGYDVRVQETDARRPEYGQTARVANIIATLPGARPEAIGLVSHYDSRDDTPGAGDDGFGVAVSLEAARVLAARENRQWTLFVLVTDAEEDGLMGAAGLTSERDVMERLRGYVNIEAVGSAGPAMLFETGPANGWLVGPWAKSAPNPRGGSFGIEIYRRLPNDTDFTIFKRRDIPGLNIAIVGDSYAYHTDRDTPDRLSGRALREAGENVVAIAGALDDVDITQRSPDDATFFDIGGTVAVSYGPAMSWIVSGAALLLGVLAWAKVAAATLKFGGWRWLLTFVWALAGVAVVAAAMVGMTWALRAAREVYHPWYARPDRLFLLLASTGVAVGWSMSQLGQWLPARAHGLRHPVVTWSVALPIWIALAACALWFAPAAAYLWMWPLLTAAVLILIVPATSGPAIRAASVVVLAVAVTLWLRDSLDVLRFMVAVLGRLPIITPVFVYAAIITLAALMIAPPFIAATAAARPLLRPSLVTALLLITVVVTASLAYVAPAYTYDQPLRRHARALQEEGAAVATWEVASLEPGLDLGDGAPQGWTPHRTALEGSVPWGRFSMPFVFRTEGPALGPAPIGVAGFSLSPLAGGTELTLTLVPQRAGLTVSLVLPEGVAPARSNLPGVVRLKRWTASYVAVPMDGLLWRASFSAANPDTLRNTRVIVSEGGMPGGEGWQRLPPWLPRDRTAWSMTSAWSVPVVQPVQGIDAVPPLPEARR